MAVNSDFLQKALLELAAFGRTENEGTTRLSYSREFLAAQDYLKEKMLELGMSVEIDEIGNLIGTFQGSEADLPAVLSGSHLDTVPHGGNYDGILGIVCALEVVRSWREENFVPRRSLKVIAAVEEEGTAFGMACFGVRARSGEFKDCCASDIKCTGSDNTLADLLSQAGYADNALQSCAKGFADCCAFVELHIEQGAELEECGCQAGIVTHIVGYDRLHLTFAGEANHAGTTAMHRRKDAAAAGAEVVLAVRDMARNDKRFVATVGKFIVEPNVPNIVPGKVSLCIETRSYSDQILQEVRQKVMQIVHTAAANNNVEIVMDGDFHVSAVALDNEIVETMQSSADILKLRAKKLPSWAGHDAQIIAKYIPAGMIFVPSVGGISHAKEEYSNPEDILAGTLLLEKVLKELTSK